MPCVFDLTTSLYETLRYIDGRLRPLLHTYKRSELKISHPTECCMFSYGFAFRNLRDKNTAGIELIQAAVCDFEYPALH